MCKLLKLIILSVAYPGFAFAGTFHVGATHGLMKQPSSQYYHFIYGGYAEYQLQNRRLSFRSHYVERPKFKSAGFSDQDYGYFTHIGTNLTNTKKTHGLSAYAGIGKMAGYISVNKTEHPEINKPRRSYQLNGASFLMEAYYKLGFLQFSAGHQSFTGFTNQSDFDADVAWPYLFYYAQVGAAL